MKFVVCIQSQDYPASLEVRKLYQVIEDQSVNQHSMIRIIDESGEDYLYPASHFASMEVPENLQQALIMVS
jgi:primosomal protein N'